MSFRSWQSLILLGLLGGCSESAEPPNEPDGARETGYLRCQAAAPHCAGVNQAQCIDEGGKPVCVDAPTSCAAFDCACAGSLCGEAACTDLPGEAIACAQSGVPATCQGATVVRPEGTYCVVPDGDQYPCPADAPARTSQRGTAICRSESVAAPEAEAADAIAVAGLQTGLILAAANVTHLDLPEAASTSPGVPSGSPVTVTATVSYSGGSGFTPDGAPVSCNVQFDHLEQRLVDGQVVIRGWDRVTCGAPQNGATTTETHPIDLAAPAPGLFLVVPGYGSQQSAEGFGGKYLVVDQVAACGETPAIETCARGEFFAECGGDLEPTIWCGEGLSQCLWFSGGCPAAGYFQPRNCGGEQYCPTPHVGWGPEPWNRERDMTVSVAIDPAVMAPEAVAMTCTCEAPPCIRAGNEICDPPEGYEHRYVAIGDAELPNTLNGLFAFSISPVGGPFGSTYLAVEVDTAAPDGARARACLVSTSDGGAEHDPICAISGALVLDRAVATTADAASAHGTASLDFAEMPLQDGPLHLDVVF